MRLLGLEPRTYGLKVRPASANYEHSNNDASASCATSIAGSDPVLASCLADLPNEVALYVAPLAAAWPTISAATRSAIRALLPPSDEHEG